MRAFSVLLHLSASGPPAAKGTGRRGRRAAGAIGVQTATAGYSRQQGLTMSSVR